MTGNLYVPKPSPGAAATWTQTRSGLTIPRTLARKGRHRYGDGVLGLDLFAGAGGFSCGMKQAGIEVIGMFEHAADATITYMMNLCRFGQVEMHYADAEDKERLNKELTRNGNRHLRQVQEALDAGQQFTPEMKAQLDLMPTAGGGWISHYPEMRGTSHVFFGDIRKFSGQQVLDALELEAGELDVLFGGPPCQGFSTAGKRDVLDERNSLIFEFARLIVELKPATFVLENVPNLINMVTPRGIPVLDEFCACVADGGWASVEALRKMLGVEKGRRGAVRSPDRKPEKQKPAVQVVAATDELGPLFASGGQ